MPPRSIAVHSDKHRAPTEHGRSRTARRHILGSLAVDHIHIALRIRARVLPVWHFLLLFEPLFPVPRPVSGQRVRVGAPSAPHLLLSYPLRAVIHSGDVQVRDLVGELCDPGARVELEGVEEAIPCCAGCNPAEAGLKLAESHPLVRVAVHPPHHLHHLLLGLLQAETVEALCDLIEVQITGSVRVHDSKDLAQAITRELSAQDRLRGAGANLENLADVPRVELLAHAPDPREALRDARVLGVLVRVVRGTVRAVELRKPEDLNLLFVVRVVRVVVLILASWKVTVQNAIEIRDLQNACVEPAEVG
mmetsp:Transcript_48700/g.74085  ORF Transcript_48700/g.74085 Transcript_48700/m.74085 type:complete len:306 (+) Transcript_48700:161-1078(+)